MTPSSAEGNRGDTRSHSPPVDLPFQRAGFPGGAWKLRNAMKWLIDKIKSIGPAPDTQLSASEKRATWRIARKVGLFAIPKGGANINVTTVDIGPGGIQLQTPQPFRKGEELTLRFP